MVKDSISKSLCQLCSMFDAYYEFCRGIHLVFFFSIGIFTSDIQLNTLQNHSDFIMYLSDWVSR